MNFSELNKIGLRVVPPPIMSDDPQLSELWGLLSQHGTNSHSFLTLYKGYRYFRSKNHSIDGVIPFVNTRYGWVAAAGAIASPENTKNLLADFFRIAKQEGKQALILPASQATATLAQELGYGCLQIGVDPIFDFDRYHPAPNNISVAARLLAKGAHVRPLNPRTLPKEKRLLFDQMIEQWLGTRKMAALQFLNRIEPWELMDLKRYFQIEFEGEVTGLVGAVPIPARQGWYIVDIFKSQAAPVGSNELLILRSMELLKNEGAKMVSLGFCPLAGLESTSDSNHPLLNTLLRCTYRYGNLFYDFSSLHQFKLKFQPPECEPCFLVYSTAAVKPTTAIAILDASLGRSLSSALWSSIDRYWNRLQLDKTLAHFAEGGMVLKAETSSLIQRIMRVRFSLVYLTSYFVTYFLRERAIFASPSLSNFLVSTFLFSIGALVVEYILGLPLYLAPIFASVLFTGEPLNPLIAISSVAGCLTGVFKARHFVVCGAILGALFLSWFHPALSLLCVAVYGLGYFLTRFVLNRGRIYSSKK